MPMPCSLTYTEYVLNFTVLIFRSFVLSDHFVECNIKKFLKLTIRSRIYIDMVLVCY